jgi:hypothetical protein
MSRAQHSFSSWRLGNLYLRTEQGHMAHLETESSHWLHFRSDVRLDHRTQDLKFGLPQISCIWNLIWCSNLENHGVFWIITLFSFRKLKGTKWNRPNSVWIWEIPETVSERALKDIPCVSQIWMELGISRLFLPKIECDCWKESIRPQIESGRSSASSLFSHSVAFRVTVKIVKKPC